MTEHLLRHWLPIDKFGALTNAAPITNGLSGARIYSAATGIGNVVLRVVDRDRPDFQNSLPAQQAAAAHGIAPAILHSDPSGGVVVSMQIENTPLGRVLAQPALRPQALQKVAKLLGGLHALPSRGLPEFDIEQCRAIWRRQSTRSCFPSWANEFETVFDEVVAVLTRDPRRVFSHNDITPANVLWDGARAWLIDWDRAASAHPYLDLATFANFTSLSDDEALVLLAAQENSIIDDGDAQTFITLRRAMRAFYGAVFFSLMADEAAPMPPARAATPKLADCYRAMARGELNPASASGAMLLGCALLAQL
jgi:thiamine kinase-like enzyme